MTPNLNSAEIFVQCTYPKFHHPVFTHSEIIVLTNKQTNKQTPLKTSNILRYATTLGENAALAMSDVCGVEIYWTERLPHP